MKRTLSLKRERLSQLGYDDLASVVAAGGLTPVNPVSNKYCLPDPHDWSIGCCEATASCCTKSGSC